MFTKILFPTDGSEHSQKTIEYVKKMAIGYNATVVVFYSYEPPEMNDMPLFYPDEAEAEFKRDIFEMINHSVEELLTEGINVKSRFMEGKPGQLIIETADEESCDLIIMGKRGSSEFKSLLIGSVSNFVLHNTKVPVLLIH
jgi:nucleotide-binding universal stress UspA family protein